MTSIPQKPVSLGTFTQVTTYNYIQTFFADREIVSNSGEISLTSVNLYFKNKPNPTRNASGKPEPGVVISICNVSNDEPILTEVYRTSITRRSFNDINAFTDASVATSFNFTTPVKLKAGQFYGIIVTFEDPGFELWENKQGDKLVGTNTKSNGSNLVKDGKLYNFTNSGIYKPLSDVDLKFGINVAKYVANNTNITYVNDGYEFLTIGSRQGDFLGGEWVYGEVANASGNIAITAGTNKIVGTGTSFDSYAEGTYIVVYGNTTAREILTISDVVNSSLMYVTTPSPFSNTQSKYKVAPVGKVSYKSNIVKKLFLTNSSANSTLKFATGQLVVGEDSNATANITAITAFSLDRTRFKADLTVPAAGGISTVFTSAANTGGSVEYLATNSLNVRLNSTAYTDITKFDGLMLSRSLEVDNANLFSNTDLLVERKSTRLQANVFVNLSDANSWFQSPTIPRSSIDMMSIENRVTNTYLTTDSNTVTIDSEVAGNGLALSRHITTKVKFANNRFAEDIKLFMTAYRPSTTDLKVYARVHNSADPDAFDDRAWTPLVYVENGNQFSSNEDPNNFIEYELGLPMYSDTANVLPGVFQAQLSNAVIAATGVTPTSYVANNDVIKLYNPLIPEDYIVAVVVDANSSSITLGSAIANSGLVGTGFKVDRLKYYNIAYNNITNDNVARYYNSSLVEFDKFDSMQIKIVLLADTTYVVPRIDEIQVIGVSA